MLVVVIHYHLWYAKVYHSFIGLNGLFSCHIFVLSWVPYLFMHSTSSLLVWVLSCHGHLQYSWHLAPFTACFHLMRSSASTSNQLQNRSIFIQFPPASGLFLQVSSPWILLHLFSLLECFFNYTESMSYFDGPFLHYLIDFLNALANCMVQYPAYSEVEPIVGVYL